MRIKLRSAPLLLTRLLLRLRPNLQLRDDVWEEAVPGQVLWQENRAQCHRWCTSQPWVWPRCGFMHGWEDDVIVLWLWSSIALHLPSCCFSGSATGRRSCWRRCCEKEALAQDRRRLRALVMQLVNVSQRQELLIMWQDGQVLWAPRWFVFGRHIRKRTGAELLFIAPWLPL